MAQIIVVYSNALTEPFEQWLSIILEPYECQWVAAGDCELSDLEGKKVLIAAQMNTLGYCQSINDMLLRWHQSGHSLNRPAEVAFMIKSSSQFYTKSYARMLGFQLSSLGFRMIGKPLLELLPEFENLKTWKNVFNLPLHDIANVLAEKLILRLMEDSKESEKRHILVVHASQAATSNTLALWQMVRAYLPEEALNIMEIGIERGSVTDCIGCDFKVCMSHAEKNDCVVGGIFVERLMPAIQKADIIVWLCPNYNDAISADLMAVINRMSGIYRFYNLYEKRFYAIVVSGNSGGDSVAMQLIDGLNLNKGFILPPHFLLSEIANAPLVIRENSGVEQRAALFAEEMMKEISRIAFKKIEYSDNCGIINT